MNCERFKELKDRYLRGEVSPEEEEVLEAHAEKCPSCRKLLDEWLTESEGNKAKIPPGHYTATDNALDEKKQQKILRRAKYLNRLNMAFFLLLLFALFNIAGSFLSSLYYNRGGENSLLYRTQKTAALLTEFTFPNVTIPLGFAPPSTFFSRAGWGHSSVEIKPYFVVKGNYAMQKQVGKESHVIGHLQINHLVSSVMTRREWSDGAYEQYLCFYHPRQLAGQGITGSKDLGEFSREAWQALEILPAGTVAELALSFWETCSIEEAKKMFDAFDVDITWYAVDTGMEGNGSSSRDYRSPLSAFNGAWGVPNLSQNMLRRYVQISSHDSAVREEYFLESMEFLMENEKLAEKIYQGPSRDLLLKERYRYLQENGLYVYGVVVTGPTKELLKLRELEEVHSPALGDVKLWNWFNRDFRGTLY